jgi:BCD family chlorophyll transporter-like MFS transporter
LPLPLLLSADRHGLHMAQTAGLALVTDLAPEHRRPRAVALLYVMLLIGTMVSALLIGAA